MGHKSFNVIGQRVRPSSQTFIVSILSADLRLPTFTFSIGSNSGSLVYQFAIVSADIFRYS